MTNAQLQTRKHQAIARGQSNLYPIFIDRALNAEVWDVEGNQYIDFATGIAVCNTGHSHPRIIEAVKQQLDRFSHTCFTINPYESAVSLAEKLATLAPGSSDKKAIFVTTGAEAVENSIKIARAYTRRRGVVAFNGSFHGRTNLTMALTGKITPYKSLFGPFVNDIYHVPFPIELQNITTEDSLNALDLLFRVDIAPTDVAAIIVEPVQGEGGFYPAPPELLQALREVCDKHAIVLIVDEIQTGFARTGKMFSHEYANIEADLITFAKGVAGGFPLSGVIGKQHIMDAPYPGGLGGTYGGSPIGCVAALQVLDIIKQENLLVRAIQLGELFTQRLTLLKAKYPEYIAQVRNQGAMIAIELIAQGDTKRPNKPLAQTLTAKAVDHGIIVLACGFNDNVIRFLPALTMTDELAHQGLDRFFSLFHAHTNEI